MRKHKQAMVYLLLKSKENDVSNQNGTIDETPVTPPATTGNKDTGGCKLNYIYFLRK